MNSLAGKDKQPLILITQSFPFGIAESSFLKEEIKFLVRDFDVQIVSRNIKDTQYVDVPKNVVLYRYDAYSKYNALILLVKAFFSKHFIKEIFTIIGQKKFSSNHVKMCLRVQMRTQHFAKYLKAIRKQINHSVILYSYWNDYACFAASRVKRQGDFLISRLHGGDLYELESNDRYQPYKYIYNQKVDWFSFISNKGKTYFCEKYFDVSGKSSINFLGVPEHSILYTFSNRKDVRLVSFSYVRDIKRIDRIIDSLSDINGLNVHWTHIGARYLYDQILQYAKQMLGGKSNIEYQFLGEMKNEEALDYIASHEFDFLINVSSTEGMPMTMMEAFSMSMPVIGTKVGGVPEVVKHNHNGYLLEVDFHKKDLIGILQNYANLSFESKCNLRENAKETWKNNFHDIINYNNFTKLLINKFKQHAIK